MRQFITILFLLIFALAGNSQVQKNFELQFPGNSSIILDQNPNNQYSVFFEEYVIDNQDINDLNGFDNIPVLLNKQVNSGLIEINKVSDFIFEIQSGLYCELLLDLPPPTISI